jgi:fatty acid-binding protein DegV
LVGNKNDLYAHEEVTDKEGIELSKQLNAIYQRTSAKEETGEIDFSRPVCLAFSGIDDSYLRKYVKDSAHLYEGHEDQLQTAYVGSTIGTYSGPGAIAVAFFAKKEN